MPHCVIEYSSDLVISPKELISSVRDGMLETNLFDEQSIKLRAQKYDHFDVPKYDHFIYVLVKILSGRSIDQKKELSQTIKKHIDDLSLPSVSLSIEIDDMEKESYIKTH